MGIVSIPGQPGEAIDQRILPDVLWFIQDFKVKVTDGYATSGHSPKGEHPLGLAVDLVPDTARGGTWKDVDRLAKLAKQNPGIFPFVGWNGYPGHGDPGYLRANGGDPNNAHLHLSWNSPNRPGDDAQLLIRKVINDFGGDGPNLSDTALGAAIGLGAGPAGAAIGGTLGLLGLGDDAADAAKDAGGAVAGAAGDVAGAAGNVVLDALGKLWDEIAGVIGRGALTVALVLAGLVLAGVGLARLAGARTPTPTGA